VLLSEYILSGKANSERATQMMFERFNVPAFLSQASGVLAVYASGRTDACVVEVGDGTSSVSIVGQAHAIKAFTKCIPIAGREITDHMMKLLTTRGYSFTTTSEREIVRDIKEKLCFVSTEFGADQQNSAVSSSVEKSYELPDGQVITVGNERFRAPEILFTPELYGVEAQGLTEMVFDSCTSADLDFFSTDVTVVLAGGSTMFPGIADRMDRELRELFTAAGIVTKLKVVAPPERKYSSWIGGSILASLSTFQRQWISKEEYDENGPAIVHRKCW